MLTDFGPGILPYQFALVQTPPSTAMAWMYWAVKFITRQRLEAAGWDTRDPVFYEQCKGQYPQGAVELSWLSQQVLQQGTANPRLPRIPQAQVRYLPARTYAVIVKNLASILETVRPAFTQAGIGATHGVGVTGYGPVDLSFELDFTDMRARREHYTVSMSICDVTEIQRLATPHRQSLLFQQLENFSNGGVVFRLNYTPLTTKGRSRRARTVDVTFPLDPLRVILRAQERITFAQGRLAALL